MVSSSSRAMNRWSGGNGWLLLMPLLTLVSLGSALLLLLLLFLPVLLLPVRAVERNLLSLGKTHDCPSREVVEGLTISSSSGVYAGLRWS